LSRFDQGRWNRVVVWTGAALAWGSALVAARLEPARDLPPAPAPASVPAGVEVETALPVAPEGGIVVIRLASAPASPAPPAAALPPAPSPAPAPVSAGS
jgi:hypothetical protein